MAKRNLNAVKRAKDRFIELAAKNGVTLEMKAPLVQIFKESFRCNRGRLCEAEDQ